MSFKKRWNTANTLKHICFILHSICVCVCFCSPLLCTKREDRRSSPIGSPLGNHNDPEGVRVLHERGERGAARKEETDPEITSQVLILKDRKNTTRNTQQHEISGSSYSPAPLVHFLGFKWAYQRDDRTEVHLRVSCKRQLG